MDMCKKIQKQSPTKPRKKFPKWAIALIVIAVIIGGFFAIFPIKPKVEIELG